MFTLTISILFVFAPMLSSFYAASSTATQSYVYVENYTSDTVTVISGTSVVTNIGVGVAPLSQMAYVPGTGDIYVTNSAGGVSTTPSQSVGNVSVIDTSTNTVIQTITGFNSPIGALYVPSNNLVYVTDWGRATVTMINATNFSVVETLAGFQPEADFLAYSPISNDVYVTCNYGGSASGGEVAVINASDNSIVNYIPVLHPRGVAFDPVNNYIYAVSDSGNVTVIDSATNTVVESFALPVAFEFDIVYNPINNDMYITQLGNLFGLPVGENVYLVNSAAKPSLVGTISGFNNPSGIAFNPANGLMYVSNRDLDEVTTIDGTSVGANVTTGSTPYGIVVSGNQNVIPSPEFPWGSLLTAVVPLSTVGFFLLLSHLKAKTRSRER